MRVLQMIYIDQFIVLVQAQWYRKVNGEGGVEKLKIFETFHIVNSFLRQFPQMKEFS